MLSSATISFDIADMLGVDYDTRRGIRAWVDTNIPGDTVVDTDGNKIRLGSGKVTVAADGTGSVSVWVPGTGSNPASWQTYFHFEYVDSGDPRKGRTTRTFGPYTITASANLADLVAEQDVPPEYAAGVLAEMQALRDETSAIAGLEDVEDAVTLVGDARYPALDGVDRTYAPAVGKTNGWEGIWDAAAGYLMHLRAGTNTTTDNAVVGIGTDKGAGNGILISHKNGGSGVRMIMAPGAGLGHYISGYGSNPALYVEQYVGAGAVTIRRRTGAGFSDGVTTQGSTTFTSASAAFTGGDVGQSITQLVSRGTTDPTGTIPDGTTIVSVTNATTVVLSAAATATVTGLRFRVAGRTPTAGQTAFQILDTDGTTTLYKVSSEGAQAYPSDATKPAMIVKGKSGQTGDIFQAVNFANGYVALRASENGAGGDMSASFNNASMLTRHAMQITNHGTASTEVLRLKHGTGTPAGALISMRDSGDNILSQFNQNGFFMTRKSAAPADAEIATGELAIWFDKTAGAAKLMVKAKDAGGTVRTATVALA